MALASCDRCALAWWRSTIWMAPGNCSPATFQSHGALSLVAPVRPTLDFSPPSGAVAYDLVNYFDAAADPAQREARVAVRGRESRAAASGCHSVDGEDA